MVIKANHFKRLRLLSGFTQVHLAQSLKISQPYLSQIERGERKAGPELRKRIAAIFNFSEDELFHSDEGK
jgi:transcriptional regulator with XRE-family HTH domain